MGYEEVFLVEFREYYRKFFGSEVEEIMVLLRILVEKYYIRVNILKMSRSELMRWLRREGLKFKRSFYFEEGIYFEREGLNFDDDYDLGFKKVVVNKFVSESVYQGVMFYVLGVLKVDKGIKFGDEVEIRDLRGFLVGIGIVRMSGKEMIIVMRGLVVEVILLKFKFLSLSELESFKEGFFYVQSLFLMVVLRVLELSEEDFIIDMVVVFGGKILYIVQFMQNRGEIIVIDKFRNRLRKMEEEFKRFGVKNVRFIYMDVRKFFEFGIEVDKIFFDVFCIVFGIRFKFWEMWMLKDIEVIVRYQRVFIWVVIKFFWKGGMLVYFICIISYEENEVNVKYMFQKGLKFEEQSVFIVFYGIDMEGVQRFYLNRYLIQGFFIVKFRKV